MSIAVVIHSVTQNAKVKAESINVTRALNQPATASVGIVDRAGVYKPSVGQRLEVFRGLVKGFSGRILSVRREKPNATLSLLQSVSTCTDNTSFLTRRLAGEYEWLNVTSGAIVRDIVANSMAGDGISDSLVEDGPTVERFYAAYPTVIEALQSLAAQTNMVFYVDEDLNLRWFSRTTYASPFSISGANILKLSVEETLEDYANVVVARVGEALRDVETQTFAGDGVQRAFEVDHPIGSAPTIKVDGVEKTVGIDGVDTGKQWYWSDKSAQVRQDDAETVLTAGNTLTVEYVGIDQIYVSALNSAQISARAAAEGNSGRYEIFVDLDGRVTREDAQSRVDQLVARRSQIPLVAIIETNDALEPQAFDLKPGMTLPIAVAGYDANGTYLVRSVTLTQLRQWDGADVCFKYRIEAVMGPELLTLIGAFQELAGSGGSVSTSALPAAAVAPAAPPADVTGVAARYEYIDTQRMRILIDYTPPSPLGDFAGVHCWQEERDVSSTPTAELDGTTLLDGTTNLGGEWAPVDRGRFVASPVVLVLDAPKVALTTRIYLASFSEGAEAALVRATDASPTPSVTLAIAPATYQSGVEYAQNVTGAMATVEYDDSQVASPKYRLRLQWAPPAIAPATWQREFGGVQIVYEYEDGNRANGPTLALNETDARSDWYDLYVGTSIIKCWFVAFDNSEGPRLNTIVGGVTPLSEATVVWPLVTRPAGAPYADNVTAFGVSNARYATNGQGQKVLLIDWAWTRPVGAEALARWGGAVIWLYLPGGERFQMTGAESAAAGSMEIGQFPTSAQTWTFRAISQDNNNNPNTDAAAPHGDTPIDTIAVAPPALGATGTEYTSNVTGASFAAAAVATSDGTTGQRVSGTFTRPADVTWGGAELRVYDGSTVVGRVSGAGSPLAVTLPNPDSSKAYTVKLVSFDVNGQTNTETAGTPQGTVLVGSAVGTLDLRKFLGASVQDVEIGPSGKIEVKALAITATKIADGAISTPKLQANSVTANEIAAGAVVAAKVAANAIAALNIQAGVITSDKLDATAINVGGGGSKPGKFAIFNAGGSQIGFIGVESGNEGAWFKSLSIGGTGFSSGKLKADSSGNVTLEGATFSLTLNGVVTEITNVFDSVDNAGLRVKRAASNNRVIIAPDDLYMMDNGGNPAFYVVNNGTAGFLGVRHNSLNKFFEVDPQVGWIRTIAMDCEINGYISSTSEYRLNGTRVVNGRKAGWSTPSGTATRSSFATSTVTLPELAERVKALIDDLHATAGHGLIGS